MPITAGDNVLALDKNGFPIRGFDTDEGFNKVVIDAAYWKDVRVDDTTGEIDYIGKNLTHKAGVGVATWYIWKYSDYSGKLSRRIEGPLIGSWTGRASLDWA